MRPTLFPAPLLIVGDDGDASAEVTGSMALHDQPSAKGKAERAIGIKHRVGRQVGAQVDRICRAAVGRHQADTGRQADPDMAKRLARQPHTALQRESAQIGKPRDLTNAGTLVERNRTASARIGRPPQIERCLYFDVERARGRCRRRFGCCAQAALRTATTGHGSQQNDQGNKTTHDRPITDALSMIG